MARRRYGGCWHGPLLCVRSALLLRGRQVLREGEIKLIAAVPGQRARQSTLLQEVDLSIVADMGTLQRLPRIVGDGQPFAMLAGSTCCWLKQFACRRCSRAVPHSTHLWRSGGPGHGEGWTAGKLP